MVAISLLILYYIILFITIILLFLYIYLKHSFNYWNKLGVPSKPTTFLGTFADGVLQKRSMSEVSVEVYNYHRSLGHKYSGVYMLHKPIFMPLDTDLIKNILTKDVEHFYDRGVYHNEEHDPLSAHLISLEGTKWKTLRQKLTPTFTSGKLKRMFNILVESTEKLKIYLDEKVVKSEPIEINKFFIQFTTDVIGSCAFGIECNSFQNPDSDFIKYGGKMFRPDFFDFMKQFIAFIFPSLAKMLKLTITNKDVDRFYRKLIRDTVEYREKNNINRSDFMQLLIQLKNQGKLEDDDEEVGARLSLDEIAAQAYLFFVAGYETTSTTLTFCVYELTKNLEVQDNAREEIIRVLKRYNGAVCYESIMEMQYVERVIQETIRKNSPAPVMQRIVTKDYQVPDSDLMLKKGQLVFIPVSGLHENPDYYPEPKKFHPDRFTEENKASRPDFTFLPFGEGPRFCIGMRFAMLEIKICLVKLILKYKFRLDSRTNDPLIIDPVSFIRSIKGSLWIKADRI